MRPRLTLVAEAAVRALGRRSLFGAAAEDRQMPQTPALRRLARRKFLRLAAAGVATLSAPGLLRANQGVTDLEGFDSVWRDAETVIEANFGRGVVFEQTGLHLDLPDHVDTGGSVPCTIRIDAQMTPEDCPTVVHLVAHGNPTPQILSVWFTPESGRAEVTTRIRLEQTQRVTLVAQMRDGRHLRTDREVSVSFGACAQIGSGSNDDVFAFRPEARVSVQPHAAKGELVPVRAVISHPMETGLRKSATDEWVRQRIISSFGARQGGVEFFKARLYPAMATNPYFLFHLRAAASGPVDFKWFDMTGPTYRAQAALAVS